MSATATAPKIDVKDLFAGMEKVAYVARTRGKSSSSTPTLNFNPRNGSSNANELLKEKLGPGQFSIAFNQPKMALALMKSGDAPTKKDGTPGDRTIFLGLETVHSMLKAGDNRLKIDIQFDGLPDGYVGFGIVQILPIAETKRKKKAPAEVAVLP